MKISRFARYGKNIGEGNLFLGGTAWFYWDPFRNDKQYILEQLAVHLRQLESANTDKMVSYREAVIDIVFDLKTLSFNEYLSLAKGRRIPINNEVALEWKDWEVSIEELLTHELKSLRKLGKMILEKYPHGV